jgi:hypothetical protein
MNVLTPAEFKVGGVHRERLPLAPWVPDDLGYLAAAHSFRHLLNAIRTGSPLSAIGGGSGSYSSYAEQSILNHSLGHTSWTMPATVALALCTTTPTVTSTGGTIVEATYTGYARVTSGGTGWAGAFSASSGSGPATSANSGTITFPACTASTSTIIGWALLDSATIAAGNVIAWGSCSSTVISTTQTPATVAAAALTITLN